MLKSLFNDFLEDLAKDAVKLINKFLVDLMDIALNCQNYISTKHLIKGLSLSKVNAVILKYAIALLILKFVQKGFSIYILQSDGDPDHDPIHILTGFCQAVAISVTFLGLYTPLVNIFETFTKAILTAIGSKGEIEAIKSNTWIEIGGDFSQNNIVQSLIEFGSVEVLDASASHIKLSNINNDKLADMISYLTENGYRIFRVVRESETLEDIFLDLTKEV